MSTMAEGGIVCFIICFGSAQPVTVPPLKGDFCSTYERIVQGKKDVDAMKALPLELRRRVQGNDLDYLCTCRGWEDKACLSKSTPR
jgi:hypothetical protein